MNQLYQRTFEHITMSEDHTQSLRAELASRCSNNKMEVIPMKKTLIRCSTCFLVTIIVLAAMSVTALACGIYYLVTYEIGESGDISEDAVSITEQDVEFESNYDNYREEDGMIIVEFDEPISAEDVIYETNEDATPSESADTIDLTEKDADFELHPYSYTEENGKITVDLSKTELD